MTGVRFLFSHCKFFYPPHPATPSPSKQREKLQSTGSVSFVCLHIKQSECVMWGRGPYHCMDFIPHLLHHPLDKESKLLGTVVYRDIKNLGAEEKLCYNNFFFFWLCRTACRISFPQSGVELGPQQ